MTECKISIILIRCNNLSFNQILRVIDLQRDKMEFYSTNLICLACDLEAYSQKLVEFTTLNLEPALKSMFELNFFFSVEKDLTDQLLII